jgi:hypothetical protein
MRSIRAFALFAALALVTAACGGDDAAETTTTTLPPTTTTSSTTTLPPTTTSTSTTTTSSTTTTTIYDGPVAPLSGLPIDDQALADRRVLGVKIDNHPNARPQSGLDVADAVMEISVEGGFTRFIALFHTTDTDYLGPIRSGRPTDPTVLRPMNAVMVLSGGQNWILNYIASRGVKMIGEVSGTYRISTRPRPHNLYGDTAGLRQTADGRGYSDEFGTALYAIAPWEVLPDEQADTIVLNWSTTATYSWQYHDGKYLRFIGADDPHPHNGVDREGNVEQISVDVLVVLEGTRYTAYPAAGVKGNEVPAIDTLGSGPAHIFYQGRVMTGTWERESIEDPFALFDESGDPMTVPPGKPWISIFPEQRSVSW